MSPPRLALARTASFAAALSALAAAGCSLSLDFDRDYPGLETVYPANFLPESGNEVPVANLKSSCAEFCDYYTDCFADSSVCHYVSKLPATPPTPDSDSQLDITTDCVAGCREVGALTEQQLGFIRDLTNCRSAATQQIRQSPENVDFCDTFVSICRSWCYPDENHQALGPCFPALVGDDQARCHEVCLKQTYDVYECMYVDHSASEDLCAVANACGFRPAGLGGGGAAP